MRLAKQPPGEARQVEVPLEWRTIAEWHDEGWLVAPGRYRFVLAPHALAEGIPATIDLPRRRIGEKAR